MHHNNPEKGEFIHEGNFFEPVKHSGIREEKVPEFRADIAHTTEHERLAKLFVDEMKGKLDLPDAVINLQMEIDILENKKRNLVEKHENALNMSEALGLDNKKETDEMQLEINKIVDKKIKKLNALYNVFDDNPIIQEQFNAFERKQNERSTLTDLKNPGYESLKKNEN